jgi:hypothetical protein
MSIASRRNSAVSVEPGRVSGNGVVVWVSEQNASADVVVDIDGYQLFLTIAEAIAVSQALRKAAYGAGDTVIELSYG